MAIARKAVLSIGRWETLTALVALGFMAQVAHSQEAAPAPSQGFYVGGGAGANFESGNRFRGGGADATDTYTPGFTGMLDLGYGLGNGLRLELEPGYTNNEVDKINGTNGSGRTQMATMMGNVLYDFNYVTPLIPLQPHIGAGIGYAHVWDRSGRQNGLVVSGQDDTLAFQGIAGLDYSLAPGRTIGVDYRYMVAHDATFRTPPGAAAHAGDLDNHAVMLTFRYQLNQPQAQVTEAAAVTPPPPPPAAAPLPVPRPYEVYFDFDKSNLTPEGSAVVDQAAQSVHNGQAATITATGHTDTVGTSSYNQALSVRRANAVRTRLVADGVPADEIRTVGVGKSDLAVPTADDVNEPRNRRVEVVIQAPGM